MNYGLRDHSQVSDRMESMTDGARARAGIMLRLVQFSDSESSDSPSCLDV